MSSGPTVREGKEDVLLLLVFKVSLVLLATMEKLEALEELIASMLSENTRRDLVLVCSCSHCHR